MDEPRRIGLFGGSFDPVHLGHLHLAALARETLALDELRFIPCRISPHKGARPPAAGADRLDMLRLATRELPWARVDGRELEREGPSYSYLTAREIADLHPRAERFWILGADQWRALPTWREPALLASLVSFAVLARDGETPEPREGYRLAVLRGGHPASSSALRAALAAGDPPPPWLPPGVERLIEERGLYRPATDEFPTPRR